MKSTTNEGGFSIFGAVDGGRDFLIGADFDANCFVGLGAGLAAG